MHPESDLALEVDTTLARVALTGGRIRVGRAPDNDLVVDEAGVSRHHLCLERGDSGWMLRDLRSRHGTRLNGGLVTIPVAIAAGDHILLSTCVLRVIGKTGLPSMPRASRAGRHVGAILLAVLLVALIAVIGSQAPSSAVATPAATPATPGPLAAPTRGSAARLQRMDQSRHAARLAADANDPRAALAHYRALLQQMDQGDAERARVLGAVSALEQSIRRIPSEGRLP